MASRPRVLKPKGISADGEVVGDYWLLNGPPVNITRLQADDERRLRAR